MTTAPAAPRTYHWLFWTLALVGVSLDQASKYLVFALLYNGGAGGHIEVLPGAFHIVAGFEPTTDPNRDRLAPLRTLGGPVQPRVNRGALFGLGQGNNLFFGVVSVAAACFILTWSRRPAVAPDWFLNVALGLILAGTMGNLYDRIVFDGVRDFLHWFKWYDWPVFNVADMCLVGGAGMLLLEAFVRSPREETTTPQAVPAEAPVAVRE